ncbi:hypothetical protein ANAPC5_01507 [Anaplasma phagocytophilum]|nr:hypothetical protein ANAPC5_01507 [Anaplasma phagocytophilum]
MRYERNGSSLARVDVFLGIGVIGVPCRYMGCDRAERIRNIQRWKGRAKLKYTLKKSCAATAFI